MQQAMISAYELWDRTVPPLREEAKSLREENETTCKMVEELENLSAGYNPLRWIFNKMAQWRQIPKLESKLATNNGRLKKIYSNIVRTADQCAGVICTEYVRDNDQEAARRQDLLDKVDVSREQLDLYREALEKTDNVLKTLRRAYSEADDAEDTIQWNEHNKHWRTRNSVNDALADGKIDASEVANVFLNSTGNGFGGANYWAEEEKREAMQAYQNAMAAIEAYKGYLEVRFQKQTYVSLSGDVLAGMNDRLGLDNILGSLGGMFGGGISGRRDVQQLDALMGNLKNAEGQIRGLRENFEMEYKRAEGDEQVAEGKLSSFRKDILRTLAERGGEQAKAFIADVMEHMTADENELRAQRRATLAARFG